jgi:para-aminobenzoate synthetase/4-amino-4-deoxychorismate lyase
MAFTLRLAQADGWLSFEKPRRILRARSAHDALCALDACDEALANGFWVAGYLSYELGAAFTNLPVRQSSVPLATLGIFDPPTSTAPNDQPFEISPLLKTLQAEPYGQAIAAIERAIYDGAVYQVNYTLPFGFAVTGDIASAFSTIAKSTGAHYQALVQDEELTLLSWSPELFLEFRGGTLRTRPMKGTASPEDESSLHGEKNRGEHIMIVDLLRNDLTRVCTDVRVEDLCKIERYPTFSTMTSSVVGNLDRATPLRDIFRATFPCGSVTGAPKRAAISHIAQLEARTRDAYCGAIGYLSPKREGWWNVAIRTAQLERGAGRFDVGGGIVIDSNADDEWREIVIKSSFLRRAARRVSILETFAADSDEATMDAHLARLSATAALLDFTVDIGALRDRISKERRHATILRLRLDQHGEIDLRSEPPSDSTDAPSICLSSERVSSNDPWIAIKTSWRPVHERAAREASARACFDALLRNERDELTEGGRTNLFLEYGGVLYTPPVSSGLLPGILRNRLLAQGRAEERVLYAADLAHASAVYIGNSARGLMRADLRA